MTREVREPGVVVERYLVPVGTRPIFPIPPGWITGGDAHRFWMNDRLLVGGSILDLEDGRRLREKHGITHALSFENEHMDYGKGFLRSEMCWTPFLDIGQDPHPDLFDIALEFASEVIEGGGTLYAHCQLGGSRGPTAGYLVSTGIFGMAPEVALGILQKAHKNGARPHGPYIEAANEAVKRWRSRFEKRS